MDARMVRREILEVTIGEDVKAFVIFGGYLVAQGRRWWFGLESVG